MGEWVWGKSEELGWENVILNQKYIYKYIYIYIMYKRKC